MVLPVAEYGPPPAAFDDEPQPLVAADRTAVAGKDWQLDAGADAGLPCPVERGTHRGRADPAAAPFAADGDAEGRHVPGGAGLAAEARQDADDPAVVRL